MLMSDEIRSVRCDGIRKSGISVKKGRGNPLRPFSNFIQDHMLLVASSVYLYLPISRYSQVGW